MNVTRREAFYQDIQTWIEEVARKVGFPAIIGINGPQGGGKTTLCRALVERFIGKTVVSLSIDDFYLTRAEQVALAKAHPGNPYLAKRGYPGTHDVALGAQILDALRKLGRGEKLAIPRYDKAAHDGAGDRYPQAQWPEVEGRVDLILFEGWMLGFPRAPEAKINDPWLKEVNEFLALYSAWTSRLDALLQFVADDSHDIIRWRIEAERNLRREGRGAMTDAEVEAYIRTFMPAYEIYPKLLRETYVSRHQRLIVIGSDRLPCG